MKVKPYVYMLSIVHPPVWVALAEARAAEIIVLAPTGSGRGQYPK
jgi:hypothetical protein